MASQYVVADNCLGYIVTADNTFTTVGILASTKNFLHQEGTNSIFVSSEIRPAKKEDFARFSFIIPTDFHEG